MPSFETEKANLRQSLKKRRKAIATSLNDGDIFKDNFLKHIKTSKTLSLAGYWPLTGELDVRCLLGAAHDAGRECGLPRIEGNSQPLSFRKWQPGDDLLHGPHATLEPAETALIFDPDIVLVPLLGFDDHGGRLGFGGGYYDRTLEVLRRRKTIVAIGVGFDAQQVARVPMQSHDQKMDWIVTPTQAIQCF